MASFTLPNTPFPNGTSVSAYDAQGYSSFPGSPPGAPIATASVSGGSLTFTGLTNHHSYFAAAKVNGEWQSKRFYVGENGPPPGIPDGIDFANVHAEYVLAVNADTSGYEFRAAVPMQFFDPRNYGELGGDDDSEVFQAAADAAEEAGGGIVVIPPGYEWVISTVTIASNVEVAGAGIGNGGSAVKIKANTPTAYGFTNKDHTNGNTDIRLRDFEINGNKSEAGATADAMVYIAAADGHLCERIEVERVYAHDGKSQGIVLVNTKGFCVTRNPIEDNARDGITLYFNCSYGQVTTNRIARCNDDHIGLNAENEKTEGHLLERIIVDGNVIIGPAPNAGSYGAIQQRGGKFVSITNNIIGGVKQFGILLVDFNKTAVEHTLIAGNTLTNVGVEGSEYRPAIGIYSGLNGSVGIKNVTVIGNDIANPATFGIHVENDLTSYLAEFIAICQNLVAGAGEDAIHLHDSRLRDVTVAGNILRGKTKNGVHARTFTGLLQRIYCDRNVATNNGESGVWLEGITNGSVCHNICSNQEAEGGAQDYGVRLASLKGTWAIHNPLCFNNVTANLKYETLTEATIKGGLLDSAPLAALTAAKNETVDNTYGEPEAVTITNLRTRVNEIEERLKAMKLIS